MKKRKAQKNLFVKKEFNSFLKKKTKIVQIIREYNTSMCVREREREREEIFKYCEKNNHRFSKFFSY